MYVGVIGEGTYIFKKIGFLEEQFSSALEKNASKRAKC
jgi:hypothetical protein